MPQTDFTNSQEKIAHSHMNRDIILCQNILFEMTSNPLDIQMDALDRCNIIF